MDLKFLISILLCFFLFNCQPREVSVIEKFVYDDENILSDAEEKELNRLLRDHEIKTTNELVIHSTDNFGETQDILLYSNDFSNRLGVGKKEVNNGAVIVFSRKLARVRINLGYGTEKVMKDKVAQKIIDSLMIPAFREQHYFEGLKKGSMEMIRFLELPENKIN